jgi:hypothetical protein
MAHQQAHKSSPLTTYFQLDAKIWRNIYISHCCLDDQVLRATFSGIMASAELLRLMVALSLPIPPEMIRKRPYRTYRRRELYPTTVNG